MKLRANPSRPRDKAKYFLATDSGLVPRGKGEKNPCYETMVFPFREGWRDGKAWLAKRFGGAGGTPVTAQLEPAE